MSKKVESGAKSGEAVEGKVLQADEQLSRAKRDKPVRTEKGKPSQDVRPSQNGSEGEVETHLAELEQRLGERIAAEVERQFQSAKDKRWSQLERQFGALSEFQESLTQAAGQPAQQDQVRQRVRKDDWLAAKTRGLLEAAGLDNDPEVKALIAEGSYEPNVAGYVEMLGDLTEIVLKRAGRPRARAAAVVQPSGDGAPAPDLQSEYEVRKRRVRPGDVNALMELKREFRQKGLEVY